MDGKFFNGIRNAFKRRGPESHFERQRNKLGIPRKLSDKPVLYLSTHRGAFDGRYPGHIAEFERIMQQGDPVDKDKEQAVIDLSKSSSTEVVELLRSFLSNLDTSREANVLTGPHTSNEPPAGFICNIIFLPPLDKKGDAREPSHTFAIDSHNYKTLLPRLGDFLKEKGIVARNNPAIES
jgi:hypothetical protein